VSAWKTCARWNVPAQSTLGRPGGRAWPLGLRPVSPDDRCGRTRRRPSARGAGCLLHRSSLR